MSYVYVSRLAAVHDEYRAVELAMFRLIRDWPAVPRQPEAEGISFPHVRSAAANLADTYVVRLFALFESLLQEHIRTHQPRLRMPGTAQALINRVALRERIPDPIRTGAHAVREYRNATVHAGAPGIGLLPFEQALSALNRFLARLPDPP